MSSSSALPIALPSLLPTTSPTGIAAAAAAVMYSSNNSVSSSSSPNRNAYHILRDRIVQETFAPNALGMTMSTSPTLPTLDLSTSFWENPPAPSNSALALARRTKLEQEHDGWKLNPHTQTWEYVPDPEAGKVQELDENDEPIENDDAFENMPVPPTPCERHTALLPEDDAEDDLGGSTYYKSASHGEQPRHEPGRQTAVAPPSVDLEFVGETVPQRRTDTRSKRKKSSADHDASEKNATPPPSPPSRDINVLVQVSSLLESALTSIKRVSSSPSRPTRVGVPRSPNEKQLNSNSDPVVDSDGLSTACECLISPLRTIQDALERRAGLLSEEWRCKSEVWVEKYEERVLSLSRTLTRITDITSVALRPRKPKSDAEFRKAACGKLHAHQRKLIDLGNKFHASFDRLRTKHRHAQATSVYGYRVAQRRKSKPSIVNSVGDSGYCHRAGVERRAASFRDLKQFGPSSSGGLSALEFR